MTRATSFFLDVLRLVAAVVVFLAHTAAYWAPHSYATMQVWAHHAVILFFVLSGYVIAYTTREAHRGVKSYTIARLSRLYSVVVPALLLTAILWVIGRSMEPEFYAVYERALPWLRFVASAGFMNEVWRMEVSPPTNTPFWSLGYEFWYYVLFGLALFIRNRRWKWIALGAASLIAGPKILLLMPAWLIGVAAYRWRDAGAPARAVALLGLAGSLAVTAAVLLFVPALPCTPGFHPWYFSGAAISDFLGGLCWALVIWFFNQTFKGVSGTPFGYQSVRWLAGHTFSLYLYHAPIVVLLSAIFPPELLGPFGPVVLMAIFVVIIGLAAVTESQRPQWTKLFSWLWDRWLMPQRRNAARAISDEGGAG